jgi:RNA polymerase sigma-70 factor (ECF subfamily)
MYATFLREASGLLRGYVARRIPNPETAEDVVQEILITVHRARHTYNTSRPVGPWLYAIADHRIADFLRRLRRIERNEILMGESATEPVHELPRQDQRALAIDEALARIPEAQRRVIEMLKIKGLSVREVASQMEMSESSVKITAFRGYEDLRNALGVKKKSKLTT